VAARRELGRAVRSLAAATVAAVVPPGQLTELAGRVDALAQELAALVPDTGDRPVARYNDDPDLPTDATALAERMPYDMIVGAANPVSPPMTVEVDGETAIGRATFPAPFQGAPGCVHGAALAAAFDIVLTAANMIAGAAGPTVSLTITYKKPTLITRPAVFEGWVTRTEERRTYSQGRLVQDGVVTVEAEGVFAKVDPARIASMHRRSGADQG
jgi:acyl-coenzyme A thioesterase PaaI-like protein